MAAVFFFQRTPNERQGTATAFEAHGRHIVPMTQRNATGAIFGLFPCIVSFGVVRCQNSKRGKFEFSAKITLGNRCVERGP